MQWVWLVLGLLLVVVVGAITYLFFVIRPRTTAQVTASVRLLGREVHGRAPESIVPATCVAISSPGTSDGTSLTGLGVLALTQEAVIFAAADPDRTLIIPRSTLSEATTGTLMTDADGRRLRARLPMLSLTWGTEDRVRQAAFSLSDPSGFIRRLGL